MMKPAPAPCANEKAHQEEVVPRETQQFRAPVEWTDDLREVLRKVYASYGLSQATKAIRELKPEWPAECLVDCIVHEANRLTLVPKINARQRLSGEEQKFVLNHVPSASHRWVADHLHRSEST